MSSGSRSAAKAFDVGTAMRAGGGLGLALRRGAAHSGSKKVGTSGGGPINCSSKSFSARSAHEAGTV